MVEEEAVVFKLIGPGLVPQTVVDVRTNVNSRIELLKKETTKVEVKLRENRETQIRISQNVEKMQKDFQNTLAQMAQGNRQE